jgi:hypothetical protein
MRLLRAYFFFGMYRSVIVPSNARGHADRFRQRGMRMNREADVGGVSPHFDRKRSFRD